MGEVEFRDLAIGDAGWLIQRHAELYAAEAGFDASFEMTVAEVILTWMRTRDPARERAFIAWDGARRAGSVICTAESDSLARLRLFFLEPDLRGRGIGRRMLAAVMEFARAKGFSTLCLYTHESHRAACALYASAGFAPVWSAPVMAYGQPMVEQRWEIAL